MPHTSAPGQEKTKSAYHMRTIREIVSFQLFVTERFLWFFLFSFAGWPWSKPISSELIGLEAIFLLLSAF